MSIWGSPWGSPWGGGSTPGPVSELMRSEITPDVAYLLVIEGIRDMFVTEHGPQGELLGSGPNSWIGQYEAAAGLPHQRVVRSGLTMPRQVQTDPDLDLSTGMFRTSTTGFQIIDTDGVLPELFAEDDKESWTLLQGLRPGVTDISVVSTRSLSRPALVPADAEWVAEQACYLDTETLGPEGQRRWWPCMPDNRYGGFGVTWVGLEHASYAETANPLEAPVNGPPRVRLSFRPLVFEGRRAALYRIYRDTRLPPTFLSWPHWGEQHDGGSLVWFGSMRDTGQLSGSHTWNLSFYGKESWLKRQLGTKLHQSWMKVGATQIVLPEEAQWISVEFARYRLNSNSHVYRSLSFRRVLAGDYASSDALFQAVRSHLVGVYNGSIAGDYATTGFDVTAVSTGWYVDVKRQDVTVQSPSTTTIEEHVMRVMLHEDVWRMMGWDLGLQVSQQNYGPVEDETKIAGYQMSPGSAVSTDATSGTTPFPPSNDYHVLEFSTRSRTEEHVYNNRQDFRRYEPIYGLSQIILLGGTARVFTVDEERPYIPDDPICPLFGGEIDTDVVPNASRWMLFRGQRFIGSSGNGQVYDQDGNLLEGVEAEPFYQWASVSWDSGSFGNVEPVFGLKPTFRVDRWMIPRSIGYDYPILEGNGDWAGVANGDGAIEVLPLSSYSYRWALGREPVWTMFPALLLSTGTATKSGDFPNQTFTVGINDNGDPFTAWAIANDRCAADMGLGIPHQLVAHNADIIDAFQSGYAGPAESMNLGRYVYGPEGYESYKMLESIARPRGLHLTMRGGRFGLQRWGLVPDSIDAVLNEDDIAGNPGQPGSTVPKQTLRATPQIDAAHLQQRKIVDTVQDEYIVGSTLFQRARDPSAHLRPGDKVHNMTDDGWVWRLDSNDAWRKLWAFELADFFSRRHFLVTDLKINRIKGQDLHTGDRVLLTNPWVVDPAGNTGVTGAFGLITSIVLNPREEVYTTSVLVYAGQSSQGPLVFAPIGKILSIAGADVVLEPDEFNVLETRTDATGFRPEGWMDGTAARVQVVTFDRKTWRFHPSVATVAGVAGSTVSLTAPFGTPVPANQERWLVAVGYDEQASDGWPVNHAIPVARPNDTFGTGNLPAKRYNDK